MKKQLTPYLFIALAFLFLGVLISYLFQSKKEDAIIQHPIIHINKLDSINVVNNKLFVLEKKLKQDSTTLSKQRDSIKAEYNKAKQDLNSYKAKTNELSRYITSITDSSSFLYCKELAGRVIVQDVLINSFEQKADSLQVKNDSLAAVMAVRLKIFNESFLKLNTQATAQAFTIDSLANISNSLSKKANKKYSVGVGVMGGVTNIGFGGCVGVSITRTIFQF
jgi:hypothetical protein